MRRRVVRSGSFITNPGRFLAKAGRLNGVAFASVIPKARKSCPRAVKERTGIAPFCFGPKTQTDTGRSSPSVVRTGLRIHYDMTQLGVDRVCVAVGGHAKFPGDIIILDFGTAVTVNVVTAHGHFLGGCIMPGPGLLTGSLHQTAARLPLVQPAAKTPAVQHNTKAAIQAGTFHLLLGGLDRIVDDIESRVGRPFTVIATGGDSELVKPHFRRIKTLDPDLAARGLLHLFHLNAPRY